MKRKIIQINLDEAKAIIDAIDVAANEGYSTKNICNVYDKLVKFLKHNSLSLEDKRG